MFMVWVSLASSVDSLPSSNFGPSLPFLSLRAQKPTP